MLTTIGTCRAPYTPRLTKDSIALERSCVEHFFIFYIFEKKEEKKESKIRWTECALAPTVHDTATMAATMAATGTDDRLETKISSRVQQGQLA